MHKNLGVILSAAKDPLLLSSFISTETTKSKGFFDSAPSGLRSE
jgi:hypothetical protein